MLKFFRNLREKLIKTLKNTRGGNEIIAFVLILIFVLLVAAPKVKQLGQTTASGVENLNTSLENTLNE